MFGPEQGQERGAVQPSSPGPTHGVSEIAQKWLREIGTKVGSFVAENTKPGSAGYESVAAAAEALKDLTKIGIREAHDSLGAIHEFARSQAGRQVDGLADAAVVLNRMFLKMKIAIAASEPSESPPPRMIKEITLGRDRNADDYSFGGPVESPAERRQRLKENLIEKIERRDAPNHRIDRVLYKE